MSLSLRLLFLPIAHLHCPAWLLSRLGLIQPFMATWTEPWERSLDTFCSSTGKMGHPPTHISFFCCCFYQSWDSINLRDVTTFRLFQLRKAIFYHLNICTFYNTKRRVKSSMEHYVVFSKATLSLVRWLT